MAARPCRAWRLQSCSLLARCQGHFQHRPGAWCRSHPTRWPRTGQPSSSRRYRSRQRNTIRLPRHIERRPRSSIGCSNRCKPDRFRSKEGPKSRKQHSCQRCTHRRPGTGRSDSKADRDCHNSGKNWCRCSHRPRCLRRSWCLRRSPCPRRLRCSLQRRPRRSSSRPCLGVQAFGPDDNSQRPTSGKAKLGNRRGGHTCETWKPSVVAQASATGLSLHCQGIGWQDRRR